MIHYFYGTLQVGIGQTLCSFEHVSCCYDVRLLLFPLLCYVLRA